MKIAEDHGIPFAVNQNLRFDPAIYLTKQFLTPERFGKPGFIQFANISIEGPQFGFGPGGRGDGVADPRPRLHPLAGGRRAGVDYCTNQNNASMYHIEFSSGAVCNYFEYHNEDNFRNETPLRMWAEKGALRANHRWNPGSRWARDLIEVRAYAWPKEIGWVTYNLPDELTNRDVFMQPCYEMCGSLSGFIGMHGRVHAVAAREAPGLDQRRATI